MLHLTHELASVYVMETKVDALFHHIDGEIVNNGIDIKS